MSSGRQSQDLLEQVLASVHSTPDPRLRELIEAVVRHLHALVTETALTRAERAAAIEFLTAVGQACTDRRQEFELLSDVLGISSLVEIGSGSDGATMQTLIGPFYAAGSPLRAMGDSILEADDPGERVALHGIVADRLGQPIEGAMLDVWQSASNRKYAVQDPTQPPSNLRGRFQTGSDGRYAFGTIRPVSYKVPEDGPVGRLLEATKRHAWRAPHLHLLVSAPGYRTLTTELFDADGDYLDNDAVFGVAEALLVRFESHGHSAPTGRFDIVLESSK